MQARGFVLQASYRIQSGLPVVHLFGRFDDGGSFLVRDARQRPHFYVPVASIDAARAAGATAVAPSDWRTFDGEPVARVEVAVPADAPPVRDRLQAEGTPTFEADVRFAMRYLIDRHVKGGCCIDGRARPGNELGLNVDWVFDDPEVRPGESGLEPRVLSFDIETTPSADRLLAISWYARTAERVVDEVVVVDPEGRAMPEKARGVPDERSALDAFCDIVRRFDPDVLTGWNVIDFDLTVLGRIAARLRHPFLLGRDKGSLRVRPARGYFGSGQASVPGRLVLDGLDLVRGAFLRFDDFSLDTVAREVLGEGKTIVAGDAESGNRALEILDRHQHDLAAFARYARTDARLVVDILQRLDLVRLAFARSRLTGMTPDRVAASIASFDFLYLSALQSRRVVGPTVRSNDSRVSAAQAGGEVFEPITGIHELVWVFDFKSLYPSLMRTFNIDPLAYVPRDAIDATHIRLANGAAFERTPAILPGLLDELFPARESAKQRGDEVASQAIKILMNSFYGVLGTPACRFHNTDIANAITGQGRYFLKWTRDWFEHRGLEVLYGDTDSVFVRSGEQVTDDLGVTGEHLTARGVALAAELTEALRGLIESRWSLPSRLELEFEKLYLKLFLPSVRGGAGGARKRYAGVRLAADGATRPVEFVGMEVVRRDWTELAKAVQRELYARLFSGADVDAYLAGVVAQVRAGRLDDELVYRKGLRRELSSYQASTPPHVAAARKLEGAVPRVIAYIMTTAGPEPVQALRHEPDREHYVDKQIRPVAEPVLGALGLDFDRVIGDDRQLGLF